MPFNFNGSSPKSVPAIVAEVQPRRVGAAYRPLGRTPIGRYSMQADAAGPTKRFLRDC